MSSNFLKRESQYEKELSEFKSAIASLKSKRSKRSQETYDIIRARSAVSSRLGVTAIAANEIYQIKNKFVFPTPTIKAFENNAGVQLTLDQSIMNKIAEDLNEIKDAYIDELLRTIVEKTPVDTGRAKAGWIRNGDDIVNPVPYVEYLETGTDKMRPIGMVASTMVNGQRILDLTISKFL